MNVVLTVELMGKLYPRGNAMVMQAFVNKQSLMDEILQSPKRAAMCFANMYDETGGFDSKVVRNMTENLNYSPEGMAETWPNRFPSPAAVRTKYGTDSVWRIRAFDDIYGSRMGNRPGTHDGSTYIGRGGPQVTGRDGYSEIGRRIGVDLLANPLLACKPELQPAIAAAFWAWKKMSNFADAGNVEGGRHAWNGGHIGLAVVKTQYAKMLKIISNYSAMTAAPNVKAPTAEIDDELKEIQFDLIGFGYHSVGKPDGQLGGATTGAIKSFFIDRGIDHPSEYPGSKEVLLAELNKAAGEIDPETQQPWHRPIAPGRAFATEKDLAPTIASIAPTQSAGWFQRAQAWVMGSAATIGGAVKLLPDANDQVSPYWAIAQSFIPSIPQLLFFAVVAAVAIITVRKLNTASKATVDDYQTGKIN